MRKFAVVLAATLALCLTAAPAFALFGDGEVKKEEQAVTFAREVLAGNYKIVTSKELKGWMEAGKKMLIVDTMPYEASYKKNHIPGAVCMEFPIPPMPTMDAAAKAKFVKLLGPDKGRLLVFYCGFTKCTRSHNGALWAVKLGYTNVYRCPGGIKAWMERDFAVKSVK